MPVNLGVVNDRMAQIYSVQNLLLKEEKATDQGETPQIGSFAENLAPASCVGLFFLDLGSDLDKFLIV